MFSQSACAGDSYEARKPAVSYAPDSVGCVNLRFIPDRYYHDCDLGKDEVKLMKTRLLFRIA